jgi:hypothetical protein
MEQRRKQYANEIRLNISRTDKAQKRDEETLKNLNKLNLTSDLYHKKHADLNIAIEKRQEDLFNLEQLERDYLSGKLDGEITREIQKNTAAEKVRIATATKKKKELQKDNDDKRAKLTDKKYREDNRNSDRDYAYYYKQYYWANESLPDYMRENLADMPNNKGYIWRNCWFLGDKPAEHGQPTIMFEKKRGGVMNIHEIDQYEHKIFEKIGKEKKRLISSKLRKIKTFAPINGIKHRR